VHLNGAIHVRWPPDLNLINAILEERPSSLLGIPVDYSIFVLRRVWICGSQCLMVLEIVLTMGAARKRKNRATFVKFGRRRQLGIRTTKSSGGSRICQWKRLVVNQY